MNYLMPDEGVFPMHSSINVGEAGDACIFFGLSGTGKTTLSADPLRSLIGDDEHGWGDGYTFNFEGGCYAKTIRLSAAYEPDIFATTKRFGTILENTDMYPETRELDLDSERFTENTRAAYPLEFIGNADPTGIAPGPRNVVFLTADAFGVLPPIAKLTREQAAYHFISGYTAKLAGTEIGVMEPTRDVLGRVRRPVPAAPPGRVRPAADGAARSRRRPGVAGEHRLDRRPARHRPSDGHHPHPEHGPGGDQRRARRRGDGRATRCSGSRSRSHVPGVPDEVLVPRDTWADQAAFDATARRLAAMFHLNFRAYADGVPEAVREAGPIDGRHDRRHARHGRRRGLTRRTP